MTEDSKQKTPYVPWTTYLNFLNETSASSVGLPPVVDRSILSNYSGSVQSILTTALRATGMTDDLDAPTQRFVRYAEASSEAAKKALIKEGLEEAFPYMFNGNFNLIQATPAQFDEQLRSKGSVSGSTLDKAANFFMAAAEYTDIAIGPYLKKRKPSAKKARRQKKPAEGLDQGSNGNVDKQDKQCNEDDLADKPNLNLHPFIEGLLKTLPEEGEDWPIKSRAKWLTLAANAFDMIYNSDDDSEIEVSVVAND